MPDRGRSSSFAWLTFGFKALAVGLMVGAPLAGVWLASSLAAFANRATWLPLLAGLLLFPGLPLGWEGLGAWRRSRRGVVKRRRFLTFVDRLILRTLAVNGVFLSLLLALFPQRAFLAASTRGDWMLDGHHGPTAETVRRALLGAAGAIEWVYDASNTNPYDDANERDRTIEPTPTPVPTPVPVPAPVPVPVPGDAGAVASPDAGADAGALPVPVAPEDTTPSGPGARYPFAATLHPVVAAMPRDAETSIDEVGRYIAAREPDPFLRAKALHDWVADRIAYDAAGYAAHRIPETSYDADAAFRSRVGVCAAYAKLLVRLGAAAGMTIAYVVGEGRSEDSPLTGESHAWNAVEIQGGWYLMDVTWDAGSVDGPAFKKKYGTEYLLTPPEQFVVTHYPDKAKWQLLAAPRSRAEFFRQPVVTPAFFQLGLELRAPDQSQVTVAGNAIDVAVGNPRSVFLMADAQPKGGGPRVTCRGDKHTRFHCDLPAAGTYDVRLYASPREYGNYPYVGAVQVNARP